MSPRRTFSKVFVGMAGLATARLGSADGRSGVFVKSASLAFLYPDADQVPAAVVALRQTVRLLASEIFLSDLTLELDAVVADAWPWSSPFEPGLRVNC